MEYFEGNVAKFLYYFVFLRNKLIPVIF